MHLNHLHLSSTDVVASSAFLCEHFGFSLSTGHATKAFAALEDSEGFSVVLMALKPGESYPEMFHVGFLLQEEQAVHAQHEKLLQGGIDVGPLEMSRGALRFYCKAPGGLLIEVGHAPGAVETTVP
ncbi:VOC family protein [Ramlibacter sp.]|uniref:VOC family protein n=1 Tax=Ramlibacter sp. TaxID=1917967 RepID=UPI0018119B6D|nr:VOC family protein [Ramlibacter sp.]MBA2672315.1 VOC family protein [Ramlibacter sp.]